MKFASRERVLEIYAGVLTAAFAITVLADLPSHIRPRLMKSTCTGSTSSNRTARYGWSFPIRQNFPGSFVNGKEIARPDRHDTGLLFLNEEGTDMGGLTFDGWKDKNAKIQNNGHLSFDQYMQDQVFSLDAGREGGEHYSVINFSDRGDYSVMDAFEAKQRIAALPVGSGIRVGEIYENPSGRRQPDGAGSRGRHIRRAEMRDPQGRDRLVIRWRPTVHRAFSFSTREAES
jgi:hypothetical protein